MQTMTLWGLVLLGLGAIAVVAESHVPTLGMIGGPGVIALGAGALLAVAGLGGSLVLGLLAALVLVFGSGGLLAVSWRKGTGVRRRRVRAGPERLIGHGGTVRSWRSTAACGRPAARSATRTRPSWRPESRSWSRVSPG
jgi:membrane-bound ClpP family serine protease